VVFVVIEVYLKFNFKSVKFTAGQSVPYALFFSGSLPMVSYFFVNIVFVYKTRYM